MYVMIKRMPKKDFDLLMDTCGCSITEGSQPCLCGKCEDRSLKEKNYLKCVFWDLYKSHVKQINEMNQRRLEIAYKVIKEKLMKRKQHVEMFSEKYPFRAKQRTNPPKNNLLPTESLTNEDIGGLKKMTSNVHIIDSSGRLPNQLFDEIKSIMSSRAECDSKHTDYSILYGDPDQVDRTLLLVEQFNTMLECILKNQKKIILAEKYTFSAEHEIFPTKKKSPPINLLPKEDTQSRHFQNNVATNIEGLTRTTSRDHVIDSSDLLQQLLDEPRSIISSRVEAESKQTTNSIVYSDSDQFDRTLLLVEHFNTMFECRINQKKNLLSV